MAYVDLNSIRAGMTQKLEESEYTAIRKRLELMTEGQLDSAVSATVGDIRNRTMVMPLKDYIELVEWTGFMHPAKPAYITSM